MPGFTHLLAILGSWELSKNTLSGTQTTAALMWSKFFSCSHCTAVAGSLLDSKPHSASGTSVSDVEPESILHEAVTEQQGYIRVSAVTCVTRMLDTNGLHEEEHSHGFLLIYTSWLSLVWIMLGHV